MATDKTETGPDTDTEATHHGQTDRWSDMDKPCKNTASLGPSP